MEVEKSPPAKVGRRRNSPNPHQASDPESTHTPPNHAAGVCSARPWDEGEQ